VKDKPIDLAAREVSADGGPRCSESMLRRLQAKGVVKPSRDAWGTRWLFGADDVSAARAYLTKRQSAAA